MCTVSPIENNCTVFPIVKIIIIQGYPILLWSWTIIQGYPLLLWSWTRIQGYPMLLWSRTNIQGYPVLLWSYMIRVKVMILQQNLGTPYIIMMLQQNTQEHHTFLTFKWTNAAATRKLISPSSFLPFPSSPASLTATTFLYNASQTHIQTQ